MRYKYRRRGLSEESSIVTYLADYIACSMQPQVVFEDPSVEVRIRQEELEEWLPIISSRNNFLKSLWSTNEHTEAYNPLTPYIRTILHSSGEYASLLCGSDYRKNAKDKISQASKVMRVVAQTAGRLASGATSPSTPQAETFRDYLETSLWHPVHLDILDYNMITPEYFKIAIYGEPGTGKSSLVKYFGRDYPLHYITPQSSKSDVVFNNSIFVIEDVDLLVPEGRSGNSEERGRLHGILQNLDEADKVIITTNRLECLDEALLRPGRIDKVFNVGLLQGEDVKKVLVSKFLNSLIEFDGEVSMFDIVFTKMHLFDNLGILDWFFKEFPSSTFTEKQTPSRIEIEHRLVMNRLKSESIPGSPSKACIRSLTKEDILARSERVNTKAANMFSRISRTCSYMEQILCDIDSVIRG